MDDVTADRRFNAAGVTGTIATPAAGREQYESDYSPRKIRVMAVILLGQTFATSMLPFITLPLLFQQLTSEFGWTPTEFALGTTSLMTVGAFSVLVIGWAIDRIGCRPIIIFGTVMVGIVTMAISRVTGLASYFLAFAAPAGGADQNCHEK